MYLLSFLPRGPAADPVAPVWARPVLLLDAALRVVATRAGRYAPSLWRACCPGALRPERLAYRAHREAERETLDELVRPVAPAF